jgi:serine/threonine protein kinase/Tol biopolymer transport system component
MMSITAGTKLGPYEIQSAIGAGGMGEVYKARDPRLGRDVAIKVLPASVSADPERLHRFEQEARAAAALNHPNILAVHDIGQHDGAPYIVSELLEGETLRERLSGGALPVRKAVEYAVQIAHGLAGAHERGITHRDLKPENVFVTSDGRVKILDFGLAKLTQPDTAPAGASFSALPTTPPNTQAGIVLGTVGYMAPEQVRGLLADHRSDIFAFGAIVYEMLSGQLAFRGETTADTMSAILMKEPPDLPAAERHIPPALKRIVDRCVEKSPAARFQSAVDLAFALDSLSSESSATPAPMAAAARISRERTAWVLFVVACVVGLALAAGGYPRDAPPRDASQFRFLVPVPPMPNPLDIAVSPDGRQVAFVASTREGRTALFVRQSASVDLKPLAGTDGAAQPFWSPDSRFIGFVAGGVLKKVDTSGGLPLKICNLPTFSGGTWNSEGTLVVASGSTLYRVPAAGGEPVAVTVLDETQQEIGHLLPYFLPDGRHFLYLAWSKQPSNRAVYVGSLDSLERKRLLAVESMAAYAQPGHLLFHRGGTLFAQSFDPIKMEITGEPVPVADQVFSGPGFGGRSAFAVSQNGVLVYRTGGPAANRRFVWFDRTGRQVTSAGEAGLYTANFDLSPDGKRIAVARLNQATSQYDIWLLDWARDASTRFTFDPSVSFNGNVVWSPDGLRIAFTSNRKGNRDIFARTTGGAGEDTLRDSSDDEWIEDWSKDGRYIAYGMNPRAGEVAADIYVLPLFGDRKPIPVVQSPGNDDEPRFSFDGNWLAYNSDESGTPQVYLMRFPPSDQKLQISRNGGVQPRWRSDGKELYYLDLDGKLMAVNITTGGTLESGTPRVLFDTKLSVDPSRDQFAVTPDGQRFLVQIPVAESEPTPITVLVNWPAGLTN